MKPLIIIIISILLSNAGKAQVNPSLHAIQSFELTMASGQHDYTFTGTFENDFSVGKQKRLRLGAGLRFTMYGAGEKNYYTAPAILSKGATGPGILFKERINANLDTTRLPHPVIFMINLFANMSYRVLPKLYAGFNIDLTGFSFGKKQSVQFVHDGNVSTTQARPARFNLLKIDDNAIGSQNSQFYLLYILNNKWAIKPFYELLYVEYITTEKLQNEKGFLNNRFRDVPKGWGIGVSYYLK